MTEQTTELKIKSYRVVNILSPTRVVLNCGSNDGVKNGDEFQVYGFGSVIKDFDTNEELERLYLPRGYGRVTVVQKRICTIKSSLIAGAPFNLLAFSADQKILPFEDVQIGDFAQLLAKSIKDQTSQ